MTEKSSNQFLLDRGSAKAKWLGGHLIWQTAIETGEIETQTGGEAMIEVSKEARLHGGALMNPYCIEF